MHTVNVVFCCRVRTQENTGRDEPTRHKGLVHVLRCGHVLSLKITGFSHVVFMRFIFVHVFPHHLQGL